LTRQNVLTAHPTELFAQVQTGEVTSRGFEIEAKANLTDQLRVTAAFTAYELKVTKDTNAAIIGNQPFLVPEVMAALFADYTFRGNGLDGVSIGGGVRYLGASYADQENTLKVPDVTLFDARLGYKADNWGVSLNVTNLFDERYVSGCQGTNVCSYGEGRVFKLKTHVTW
jgi:iron complex outermembrane receptor protein